MVQDMIDKGIGKAKFKAFPVYIINREADHVPRIPGRCGIYGLRSY